MLTRRGFIATLGAFVAGALVRAGLVRDEVSGWERLERLALYELWQHTSGLMVWWHAAKTPSECHAGWLSEDGLDGQWRWTTDIGDGMRPVAATGKAPTRDEAMRLAVKFEPIHKEMEARIAASRQRHLPNGVERSYEDFVLLAAAHAASIRLIRASYGLAEYEPC